MTNVNDTKPAAIDVSAIEAAAVRLAPFVTTTPLLENERLNAIAEGRVFVKAECLQRTGSFKFRGAVNAVSRLPPRGRKAGVVAYSSGNHAQGVALAAKLHNVPACIVMPADAPAVKIENTQWLGAEVRLYDRLRESREAIAEQIAADTGAVLIAPFDNLHVIAGQGTVGLEAAAQAAVLGVQFDSFIASCSGGGLSAGCAVILKGVSPKCRVYVAEPVSHDDMTRSLESGEVEANELGYRSICDALMQPTPGEITLPILRRHGAKGFAVSDDEVLYAMRFAAEELKLVLEPGGAAALAGVLKGKLVTRDKSTCLVCTGGNVDPGLFQKALRSPSP